MKACYESLAASWSYRLARQLQRTSKEVTTRRPGVMDRAKLLAAAAIVVLLSTLSVTPVLCHGWGEHQIWPNQGGGIRNRREDSDENSKISKTSVKNMSLKWTAHTGYDVPATPSIDGRRGAVYFSSLDGYQYAVEKDTGKLIWKVNLTDFAPIVPGLIEGAVVIPYLKGLLGSPYPDLANLLCRSTPTIAGSLLIFGVFNPCYVLALNRSTGALVWWTKLDSHPFCVFTQSGTYYEGSFYIGISSEEERNTDPTFCCTFQGAFFKLDAKTGKTLWRTSMLPYNNNQTGLYAGAAIWGSSPAIDVVRKLVYIATGNTYSVPPAVEACENARANATGNVTFPDPCIEAADHSESIVAFDLDTGNIFWARHLGGFDVWTLVCASTPVPLPNCPSTIGGDYDFGEAPFLLTIKEERGTSRDIVVAGQKSGVVHALDRATGDIVWQTQAGPGGLGGGASWGMTTDGERVFTNILNTNRKNFTLVPSSTVVTWGGWVGMNATTGKVLWSTANPEPFPTHTPVAHVNGVIFAGSTGNSTSGIPNGQIVALDAVTGAILWEYKTNGSTTAGASIMDGCIFQPVGIVLSLFAPGRSATIHGHSTISLCAP